MTLELRLGEGEGMSHVETITGRGGGHCKGANARAGLTTSGAEGASAARAQGPGAKEEEIRSERLQKPYQAGPFLRICLGKRQQRRGIAPPPLYPT